MWRVRFFKTELVGGSDSWLDWVVSSSREVTERPVCTFCPVVLQLSWGFNFGMLGTCATSAACKSRATLEIQSRIPISLHNLEHFFTFSHTLPLHDSHLNTGLLIAKIQANLIRNKANKMVDKIQPYKSPILVIPWQNSKTNSRLNMWVGNSRTKLTHT